MISQPRLAELLGRFSQLRIGLIGDLFLDRYLEIDGQAGEYSIETGLEAFQVRNIRNSPGALGTVINNLAALGVGQLVPITVIGSDGHGFDLLAELDRLPVVQDHVIRSSNRATPTYTKPLKMDAEGRSEELNRLDVRNRGPMPDPLSGEVCSHLQDVFAECDGWIVLDQIVEPEWGVINATVRSRLARLAGDHPEKLIVVDSRAHLAQYERVVLKGNQSEITQAAGVSANDRDAAREAAIRLARRTGQTVCCTLGAEGCLIVCWESSDRTEPVVHLEPAVEVAGPIDIVGAGDSVTSGLVAARLAGARWPEAAAVANRIASITIRQLGTTGVATPEQLLQ